MSRAWKRQPGAPQYWCAKCDRTLPADEFRTQRGYIRAYCKACSVERVQQWRSEHRDTINERRRQHRAANHDRYIARERLAARVHRHPLEPKRCVICLTEFTPNRRSDQKYCQSTCAKRAHIREVRAPKSLRQKILRRDQWRCYICGRDIDPRLPWPDDHSGTVDHVKPVAAGGTNDADNLRAAHWVCNVEKGDKLLSEIWVAA